MTQNYHTAIATGAAANASTFNTPLSALDTQLTATQAAAAATTAEVVASRDAYGTLDARLDAMVFAGGNIATLTDGAASAAQKVVTVDSTTGFIAGAYVAYLLVGGALEYNTIDTVDSPTQLTMDTNVGTGGIANDTYISMISSSEYAAANAIPHAGTLTLPQAMEYAAGGVYNVRAYGAVADADGAGNGTDNAAAIQAAITAAGSGIVYLPPGGYKVSTSLDLTSLSAGITLRGDARESTVIYWHAAGGNVLDLTGSQYVKIENLTITAGYYADGGVNYYADCGILIGRKAGAGSAGNHIIRDVHLNNYFRKAGIYSLSSEVNQLDNIHIYQRYAAACYHHSDTNDLTAASAYETLTALAGNATVTTIIGGSWANWSPTGGGLAYIKNTTGLTINGLSLQTDGTPAVGAITFSGAVNSVSLIGIRQEGTPAYGIHIKTTASVLNQAVILGCYFTASSALIYGDTGTTMQYSTVLGTFNTNAVEQIDAATLNGCLIDTLGLTATVRTAALNNIWLNVNEAEPDITGGIGNVCFSQFAAGNPRWVINNGGLFASDLGWGIKASASAAGNTLGTLTRKVSVWDEAGNVIGYVPLYDGITQV